MPEILVLPEGYGLPHFLLDCATVLPSQIVFAFTMQKIARPYAPWLYWVVLMSMTILWAPFRTTAPLVLSLLVGVVVYSAVVVAFLRGEIYKKLLLVLAGYLLMLGSELPSGLLWVSLTGLPTMDYEAVFARPWLFFLAAVVYVGLYGLLMWVLYVICKRFRFFDDGASTNELAHGAFVPYLCGQLVALYGVILVVMRTMSDDLQGFAIATGFFVLYAGVDILLLLSAGRYQQSRILDLRADALTAQADEYLLAAAEMQASLREAATLRHDLRNHMHVVAALCERGERAEARAYLEEMHRLP